SRIITPAFVQALTFWTALTSVVISSVSPDDRSQQSSAIRWGKKWNASAAPQMSAPLPWTTSVPSSLRVALPAAEVAPTSCCCQGSEPPAGPGSGAPAVNVTEPLGWWPRPSSTAPVYVCGPGVRCHDVTHQRGTGGMSDPSLDVHR